MAPFDLTASFGPWMAFVAPLVLGMGFGAVLEMSGFGDSRKLAAQFYFKDLTVLKVMFTAIVVAAVLLGLGSALGWLDLDRVWVNPTFLVPGTVGGLIMGVGFIIGGFCPGTSLVAAATLKLDGIVFVLGVTFGIFAFGETVGLFEGWWNSTDFGRLTLPEVFGAPAGVVILLVVLMALFMFLLAEVLEAWIGRGERPESLRFLPRRPLAWAWGGTLGGLALAVALLGPLDPQTRWERVADVKGPALEKREVHVSPQEVVEVMRDTSIYTRVLDLRSQAHYNLFHLQKSINVGEGLLDDPGFAARLKAAPPNTVYFLVSNDEAEAEAAWRLLAAQDVLNLYLVEGGINHWLEVYPPPPCVATRRAGAHAQEELAFDFLLAAGDRGDTAFPERARRELPAECRPAVAHQAPAPLAPADRKVRLQKKKAVKGGCG
jgi:hypothetical protein